MAVFDRYNNIGISSASFVSQNNNPYAILQHWLPDVWTDGYWAIYTMLA